MKHFYIAAHARDHARLLMNELRRRGHQCTATWIDGDAKFESGGHSDQERQQLAVSDEHDVRRAVDGLILLSEAAGQNVPGGKHVETGIALALGYPLFVVGRRENIFHWHPRVKVFASSDALLNYLERTDGGDAANER